MITKGWLKISVLALFAVGLAAAQSVGRKKFEEFKRTALDKEAQGRWKKILWQESIEEAQQKAKSQDQPLLVALVVGHLGQKGAAEC